MLLKKNFYLKKMTKIDLIEITDNVLSFYQFESG